MAKFKKGDKVKRIEGWFRDMGVGDTDTVVRADDEEVLLEKFGAGHSPSTLTLIGEASWDYAEARRLQDAAKAAVEAYNDYIKRRPTDVFPEVWNPFQS